MDRSRHTTIKYLKASHADRFFNKRFFKSLNELKNQVFEVGMSKTRIEHEKPIFLGFFILLYAKIKKCRFLHKGLSKNL